MEASLEKRPKPRQGEIEVKDEILCKKVGFVELRRCHLREVRGLRRRGRLEKNEPPFGGGH